MMVRDIPINTSPSDIRKMIESHIRARGKQVGLRTAIIEARQALFEAECSVGHDDGINRLQKNDSIARRQGQW